MKKVLLINTVVETEWHVADILVIAGYEVTSVSDHIQVLELIQQNRPQLVIFYTYKPGSDFFDLLQSLKQESVTPEIPLLFITSGLKPDKAQRVRKSGTVKYLQKPYTTMELLGVIKQCIVA